MQTEFALGTPWLDGRFEAPKLFVETRPERCVPRLAVPRLAVHSDRLLAAHPTHGVSRSVEASSNHARSFALRILKLVLTLNQLRVFRDAQGVLSTVPASRLASAVH